METRPIVTNGTQHGINIGINVVRFGLYALFDDWISVKFDMQMYISDNNFKELPIPIILK